MRKQFTKACTTMLGLLAMFGTARAATITVTNTADSGPGSFREAVLGSAANDTIRFHADTDGQTILLTSGEVLIGHGLVILGNDTSNTLISAGSNSRLLNIQSAGTVVIKGLHLANGSTAASGGLVLIEGSQVDFVGVSLFNGVAAVSGGAVYAVNSTVSYAEGYANANVASGTDATNGGGAFHVSGTGSLSLLDCELFNNTAASNGGGIHASVPVVSLSAAHLLYNRADGSADGQGGGGAYVSAGAITVSYSQISANRVDGTLAGGGGLLLVDGADLTAEWAPISSNVASRAGGGIEARGAGTTIALQYSMVEGNTAGNAPSIGYGAGIHLTGGATGTILGGTVNNNVASTSGGGIALNGGSLNLNDVTINNNSSRGDANGDGAGAILNNGGNVSTMGVRITNNFTEGDLAVGGAILNNGGTFALVNSEIEGNQATISGGAVYNQAGTVNVLGCSVYNNAAAGDGLGQGGGAIRNEGTVLVERSAVYANTASGALGSGGAIYNNGTLTVSVSTLSGNVAVLHGGAIFNGGGTMLVSRSTVASNTAGGVAGGIASVAAGNLLSSIVAENSATAGEAQDLAGFGVPMVSNGYNLIGRDDDNSFDAVSSDIEGTPGAPVNALLGAFGNNGGPTYTHPIQCGSPAVNAGAIGNMSADQRNMAVFEGRRDIGAYELQESCPCTQMLNLAITLDNNGSETTWELIDNASNAVLFSGGPYADGIAGTVVNEELCLGTACYRLVVYDAGGDGILDGGYELTDLNGRTVLVANGLFTDESVIKNSAGVQGSFCLPLSNQKLIDTRCGAELRFWNSTQLYASFQPGATGYEFWMYDPHGTYSRKCFSPTQNFHPLTLVTLPVPANLWLNVRIRALVGGEYTAYGKACEVIFRTDLNPGMDLANDAGAGSFSVFPNPSTGENITLVLTELPGNEQMVRFEVFDMQGKVAHSSSFGNNGPVLHKVVNFGASLPKGVYMARLQVGDVPYTERLIVQ